MYSIGKYNMLKCSPIFTCDITHSFFLSFFVWLELYINLNWGFVVNQTPDKWQPMERMPCSDTDLCFWQDLYICSRQCSWVLKDYTHVVQVDCILLSKGQYILCHIHQCFSRTNSFLRKQKSTCHLHKEENTLKIY
jgi:hypothetical protein